MLSTWSDAALREGGAAAGSARPSLGRLPLPREVSGHPEGFYVRKNPEPINPSNELSLYECIHESFQNRGPQDKPKYVLILIMSTPKNGP